MNNKYDYDFLIIGGGSAGATAAMTAVSFGVEKILIVEKGPLGGTCTNIGCVPSKSYLHGAALIRDARKTNHFLSSKENINPNFDVFVDRKNKIIDKMRSSGEKTLKNAGVKIIKGQAVLKDDHSVFVNSKVITAKNILISTGASSFIPPIEGLKDTPYLTSTSALGANKLPESILIVGGAYIGLEFASFYNSLGIETTVIETAPVLAPNEDIDISKVLEESLANQGINIATNTKVLKIEGDNKKIDVVVEKDEKQNQFSAKKVMIATGRLPDFDSLGLEDVDIKYGRRGIEVNNFLQTQVPSIFAAGDSVPSLQLEHVAVYEGWLAANNIFSNKKIKTNYRVIPRVMFSNPEVASVGETEQQAKERTKVASSVYPYKGIAKAQISEETEGLIKIVAETSSGQILGVHIVGQNAGDLIHLGALAMQSSMTVREIADTVSAYPTLAQGFFYCAEKLAENI